MEIRQTTNTYNTADDFFNTLEDIPQSLPIRDAYTVINRVFRISVDARLKGSQIRFSGFFAKVDYLLKRCDGQMPDYSIPRAVNELRVRLHELNRTEGQRSEKTEVQKGRGNLKTEGTEEQTDINVTRTSKKDVRNGSDDAKNSIEGTEKRQLEADIATLAAFIGLIYGTEVPESLSKKYPYVRPKTHKRLLEEGRTLRVVAISIDETRITATREDTGEECRIAYMEAPDGQKDRSYLRNIVAEGTPIALVRPRVNDETDEICPEHIIVLPDYLIDISSIAACFDEYGNASPYTYILNKLRPRAQSEAIILGNFASQLLDETVYGTFHGFQESFARFARHNALTLATCPVGDDFKQKAEEQLLNIQHAICESLHEITTNGTTTVSNEAPVILEPSFYSPTLGIQGRMDYLWTDFHVVIEQKSGRGAYNPQNPDTPRARTPHYVQLLLYRALLHYGGYRPTDIYSFLLYSKYADSLLAVGNAPRLLDEALKLRNQIAWLEEWLTHGTHATMLARLTPERVSPEAHGYGWEHFTRPQIMSVLAPIQSARPLERAYFYRFLRFIQTEQVLSKLGNRTKEGSGFASAWNDSLQERIAAGNIYDRLTMTHKHRNADGQVDVVTLSFPDTTDTDVSNFREGDIVMLYSYNPLKHGEPLATRHIVFRGTILRITDSHIDISLRNPQTDGSVLSGTVWAVEHDFMESSSSALYRGLLAFLNAPLRRRQLILSQRKPEVDSTVTLTGDYTNPTTGDSEFNRLVLRVKHARDFFLIIGPPGTGKTSYGMLNVLKEQLLDGTSSVLVTAYTNRAVDELCQKLSDEGIDYLRIGSTTGCAERFRSHLLDNRITDCGTMEDVQALIHRTRVVCGTTTAFNSHLELLSMKSFALAIVDEASQILEPQLLGLLSAQKNSEPSVGKFVLIGDEKQLPAVVQQSVEESAIDDELLTSAGITDCRMSLFERLMRTCRRDGQDNSVSYMLTRQGRMRPEIADFPNRAFYGGRLKVVPLPHQQGTGDSPVRFITYDPPVEEEWESEVSDKVNVREARIIARLVWDIWRQSEGRFDALKTVGVIVPYRNQVATVRREIEAVEQREGISGMSGITIDTVERYQGSQRDTIIYGFTVKRDYQLDFLTDNQYTDPVTGRTVDRKLNVAMTRAMRHLVMVGNPRILRKNSVFSELLDYSAKHGYIVRM